MRSSNATGGRRTCGVAAWRPQHFVRPDIHPSKRAGQRLLCPILPSSDGFVVFSSGYRSRFESRGGYLQPTERIGNCEADIVLEDCLSLGGAAATPDLASAMADAAMYLSRAAFRSMVLRPASDQSV